MFFKGFATGLAKSGSRAIQEGAKAREKRLQEQMEEARAYAKLNKTRQAEATAAHQEIKRKAEAWGVDEAVMFDAWRSGIVPGLAKIKEKYELETGRPFDPTPWISLSTDFDEEVDVSKALDEMYGVMTEYGSRESVGNSLGLFNSFARILGGDTEGAVEEMLNSRTIQGYNAAGLLDMPEPKGYSGSASINFAAAGKDDPNPARSPRTPMGNFEAVAANIATDFTARRDLGAYKGTAEKIQAGIMNAIATLDIVNPGQVYDILDDIIRFDEKTGTLAIRQPTGSKDLEEWEWQTWNVHDMEAGPTVGGSPSMSPSDDFTANANKAGVRPTISWQEGEETRKAIFLRADDKYAYYRTEGTNETRRIPLDSGAIRAGTGETVPTPEGGEETTPTTPVPSTAPKDVLESLDTAVRNPKVILLLNKYEGNPQLLQSQVDKLKEEVEAAATSGDQSTVERKRKEIVLLEQALEIISEKSNE